MRGPPFVIAMLGVMLAASGCSLGRPDQDNYSLPNSSATVKPLMQQLAKRFGSELKQAVNPIPDADPATSYAFETSDFIVEASPIFDRQCVVGYRHLSFREGNYQLNLAYKTSSKATRQTVKNTVFQLAKRVGQPVEPLKEC